MNNELFLDSAYGPSPTNPAL